MDSMNLWIDIAHPALVKTIALVDCLVLNDSELKQLTDEPNLVRAAHKALDLGPRVVIAKQGEYGSAMFTHDGYFGLTAYPTREIVEPTGAGDTFAGGLMGYLAARDGEVDDATLRRAMAYGTACASFNVEGFGSERLYELDRAEVDARVEELEAISRF
jgi:cytidine kinase